MLHPGTVPRNKNTSTRFAPTAHRPNPTRRSRCNFPGQQSGSRSIYRDDSRRKSTNRTSFYNTACQMGNTWCWCDICSWKWPEQAKRSFPCDAVQLGSLSGLSCRQNWYLRQRCEKEEANFVHIPEALPVVSIQVISKQGYTSVDA